MTGGGLPLLSDHLRFVRRHRVLLAVLVAAGLGVGMVLALRQPTSWSATASVALAPVPKYVTPTTELVAPEVTVDTDAQLLLTPEVLGAVATEAGVDAEGARERISVSATPHSHVLHVTVRAGSAERAADAANAAVAALAEVRRDHLGALRDDQVREVRLLLTGHQELLTRIMSRRLVVTATDEAFTHLLSLRAALDELEEARAAPVQVLRPATPPPRADHGNLEVPVVSGAALGLLLGCLLGGVRDRRPHPAALRAPALLLTPTTSRP